jgi:hypothetical protein
MHFLSMSIYERFFNLAGEVDLFVCEKANQVLQQLGGFSSFAGFYSKQFMLFWHKFKL